MFGSSNCQQFYDLKAKVCYAGNATVGLGGQGEFLRQMAFSLDHIPRGCIFSRNTNAVRAEAINLTFSKFPTRQVFDAVSRIPGLRRNNDWLTLLDDSEFDQKVSKRVGDVDLFDGVMLQCAKTLKKLKHKNTCLVLTCLNTHIDNLIRTLKVEYRKLGITKVPFAHPLIRKRAMREFELADHIRVNSNLAKLSCLERGIPDRKVSVIYPAIEHEHFYPTEKKDRVFRVLVVSSVNPRKGVFYLLQAFEEARIPNSELVVIGGTGDHWSKEMLNGFLRRNANVKQCHMNVSAASVAESYGRASIVVHPAIEDGFGLVIPQALASGKPVIATKQSGASELILDGTNGFVVEGSTVQPLKELLQLLASDRSLLEKLSRNAPASVAHLTYQNFASQVLGLYKNLLNG